MDMELHRSSKKHDWGTPTKWFNDLHQIFKFDIDVCAMPHNNKLPRFWTPEDNALTQDWRGLRCWCNPPYGRALPKWTEKVVRESFFAELIAFLVPVSTSTQWFRKLMHHDAKFCFIEGKIKFEAPGVKHGAPFHSVLAIIGQTTQEEKVYLQSIGFTMTEL
jgi:phage N-6-adenine-methyltransferase